MELCILDGAKGEIQLFELSNWGERVELASEATFSRVKTRLGDHGLVETGTVRVEIGRSRRRLVLFERPREYEAGDLPAAVRASYRRHPPDRSPPALPYDGPSQHAGGSLTGFQASGSGS